MVWPIMAAKRPLATHVRTASANKSTKRQAEKFKTLLQLRVLGFGLLQDGNIRVGVFPQRQKILIRGAGFGGVALHGVGAGEAEMGQRACCTIPQQPAMVENFLKFGGGGRALLLAQVSLGADVHGIQTGVDSAPT